MSPGPEPTVARSWLREGPWLSLPALAVIVVAVAPLLAGTRTLLLRDVFSTHLLLRASLGASLAEGALPILDPLRGGLPLAGNPNAVPFYPDNLLLLFGSSLWQLNAHFAVHWLVALLGAFALGRTWGLTAPGSAACASAFALSGYWYSQMNLYNEVVAVALAPGLWAALLASGSPNGRHRASVAAGVLWGLSLLGGDPPLAAIALAAGLCLAVARHGRALPWRRLSIALALGTLIAAPQIVETWRIFPVSYRAIQGYAADGGGGIRDARTLVDLLIPTFFGRPDLSGLWGNRLFGGFAPFFLSLFPGALVIVGAGCAGAPVRREARWLGGLAIAAGLLVYSGGTGLPALLASLPGAGIFRFPEKLFLIPALALAIAAGSGLDRLGAGVARRAAILGTAGLAAATAALWLFFGAGGDGARAAALRFFGGALDVATWEREHVRWAGLALFVLALLGLAILAARTSRRRPRLAAWVLLTLHAASQGFFLRPLIPTDDTEIYRDEPPVVGLLAPKAALAHGGLGGIFGDAGATARAGEFPDRRTLWFRRREHAELGGPAALMAGRRVELAVGPEGLDPFVVHALTRGMAGFSDARRVAVLRAIGVDRLVLARPLEPSDAGGARQLAEAPGLTRPIRVYEIPAPLPEVTLAGTVVRAPHVNAALEAIWSADFDPATMAVVPGEGPARQGPSGEARLTRSEPERIEIEVDSPAGGVLVLRRSHLPIWKATIDGAPVATTLAQVTRLAVEVPAGAHRVELRVSRRPLHFAFAASAAGALGLALLGRRRGRGGERRR